jgi:hypothetical protein
LAGRVGACDFAARIVLHDDREALRSFRHACPNERRREAFAPVARNCRTCQLERVLSDSGTRLDAASVRVQTSEAQVSPAEFPFHDVPIVGHGFGRVIVAVFRSCGAVADVVILALIAVIHAAAAIGTLRKDEVLDTTLR